MPFSIERNDLAHMDVDAVVVAANEELQITGGVGADVANAAGFALVQRACDEIGFCPTGSAVATSGFDLHATTIVHAVGPIWQGGDEGESEVLRATYASALRCCKDANAQSLAMPLISAGTYGFPSEVSFKIAMEEIRAFLDENDIDVRTSTITTSTNGQPNAMSAISKWRRLAVVSVTATCSNVLTRSSIFGELKLLKASSTTSRWPCPIRQARRCQCLTRQMLLRQGRTVHQARPHECHLKRGLLIVVPQNLQALCRG